MKTKLITTMPTTTEVPNLTSNCCDARTEVLPKLSPAPEFEGGNDDLVESRSKEGDKGETDEWTVVSKSQKNKSGRKERKGSQESREFRVIEKVAPIFRVTTSTRKNDGNPREEEEDDDDDGKKLFELEKRMRTCMSILEKTSFMSNLAQRTAAGVSGSKESERIVMGSKNDPANSTVLVCYGIGNFDNTYNDDDDNNSPSTTSHKRGRRRKSSAQDHRRTRPFSVPMLQLCAALVLRNVISSGPPFSSSQTSSPRQQDGDSSTLDHETLASLSCREGTTESYNKHPVRLIYHEPLMTRRESTVLQQAFEVQVLQDNFRGKWVVNEGARTTKTGDQTKSRLIFFMPHCPMRLYVNVLWAHWHCLWDGCVLIGNSFERYEDRLWTAQQRKDSTNAVLRIMPHVREEPLLPTRKETTMDWKQLDMLSNLELAFNDCSIVQFCRQPPTSPHQHAQRGTNESDHSETKVATTISNDIPPRPDEYIPPDNHYDEVL